MTRARAPRIVLDVVVRLPGVRRDAAHDPRVHRVRALRGPSERVHDVRPRLALEHLPEVGRRFAVVREGRAPTPSRAPCRARAGEAAARACSRRSRSTPTPATRSPRRWASAARPPRATTRGAAHAPGSGCAAPRSEGRAGEIRDPSGSALVVGQHAATPVRPPSRLAVAPWDVRRISLENPTLEPASGIASPRRVVCRNVQGSPHLGHRTRLARAPRVVAPAEGEPAAEAAAVAPSAAPRMATRAVAVAAARRAAGRPPPPAHRSGAPRSTPGCAPATTPAPSSGASSGMPPTSRRAAVPPHEGRAGTSGGRSGRGASSAACPPRCRPT
jgi:hypothetical protein